MNDLPVGTFGVRTSGLTKIRNMVGCSSVSLMSFAVSLDSACQSNLKRSIALGLKFLVASCKEMRVGYG